jgi:hypothetical protein
MSLETVPKDYKLILQSNNPQANMEIIYDFHILDPSFTKIIIAHLTDSLLRKLHGLV